MTETLEELLAGNDAHAEAFASRFDDVQDGQSPDAVSVCCADSRVLQDHALGNDQPGRVFGVTNVGNRVVQETAAGRVVSGDVLYPIEHTDTDTAVVLGHTGCGAVTATYDALTVDRSEPPGIQHCIDLLAPGLESAVDALPEDLERERAINHLVEANVDSQVASLTGARTVPEDVTVVGAVYDFQDVYDGRRGEVHVINVDGVTDVDRLRGDHPAISERIRRLTDG